MNEKHFLEDYDDHLPKVLVVEDEPGVRDFVKRGLLSVGYDVTVAEDGEQALELLQDREFDLMVTDIVMPALDGIALTLRVSQKFPRLRILMMSGYATERQRAHSLEALPHAVLPKPFSLKALLAAVDELLGAGRLN